MKTENKNGTYAHLIYDNQPSWVKLYELACELAENNVEKLPNDGWLSQMTCMPGVGLTWQWDSCFMAMFSKYSNHLCTFYTGEYMYISAMDSPLYDGCFKVTRRKRPFIVASQVNKMCCPGTPGPM